MNTQNYPTWLVPIEGSRRRKKLLGRPSGPSQETLEKYQYALHLYNNKYIAIDKGCKQAKISKTSFYRIDKRNNKL